jgi:hypothetical protein
LNSDEGIRANFAQVELKAVVVVFECHFFVFVKLRVKLFFRMHRTLFRRRDAPNIETDGFRIRSKFWRRNFYSVKVENYFWGRSAGFMLR